MNSLYLQRVFGYDFKNIHWIHHHHKIMVHKQHLDGQSLQKSAIKIQLVILDLKLLFIRHFHIKKVCLLKYCLQKSLIFVLDTSSCVHRTRSHTWTPLHCSLQPSLCFPSLRWKQNHKRVYKLFYGVKK